MMTIQEAIHTYNSWLRGLTFLVEGDLLLKSQKMERESFYFLRSTYFRWTQLFKVECPEIASSPEVLAVGDLHIENFGTWRDSEGRLIWGINDFDEAFPLPFTNDLVRLTTSAFLAIEENHLQLSRKDASSAIMRGYMKALEKGGRPFVLEEKHSWLRAIALSKLKEPVRFWNRFEKISSSNETVSQPIQDLLKAAVPSNISQMKIARRSAGLGSLGLPRYIVMGKWAGGYICRELKYLPPPSNFMIGGNDVKFYYQEILNKAIRCKDPFFKIEGDYTIRRLSPHCSKINLHLLPVKRDEKKLLEAMGFETANIHLGSLGRTDLAGELEKLPAEWLHESSKSMQAAITKDYFAYRGAVI